METLFSKLHEVRHNPIIAVVIKRNSNIRERFKFFIIAMFLMQNYRKWLYQQTTDPYIPECKDL